MGIRVETAALSALSLDVADRIRASNEREFGDDPLVYAAPEIVPTPPPLLIDREGQPGNLPRPGWITDVYHLEMGLAGQIRKVS